MQPNGSDDPHGYDAQDSHDEHDEHDANGSDQIAEGDPLDHLWNAAHEMLGALRGLLEAADEFVESQRARPARRRDEPREGRVHHIDIDVRTDDPATSDTGTDAS
jgi:hypothetical protein